MEESQQCLRDRHKLADPITNAAELSHLHLHHWPLPLTKQIPNGHHIWVTSSRALSPLDLLRRHSCSPWTALTMFGWGALGEFGISLNCKDIKSTRNHIRSVEGRDCITSCIVNHSKWWFHLWKCALYRVFDIMQEGRLPANRTIHFEKLLAST